MDKGLEDLTELIDAWTQHISLFVTEYFAHDDLVPSKGDKKHQRTLGNPSMLHLIFHLCHPNSEAYTQGRLTSLVSGYKRNTEGKKEHKVRENRVKKQLETLEKYKLITRKMTPTSSHGTVSYKISATQHLIGFIEQFIETYLTEQTR